MKKEGQTKLEEETLYRKARQMTTKTDGDKGKWLLFTEQLVFLEDLLIAHKDLSFAWCFLNYSSGGN